MLKRFNVRAYGLLVEDAKIFVADELIRGNPVTKFPGGGLELGEGLKDCLRREFKEETGFDVEVTEHFYTTDFFQQSAFNDEDQIISVYFFVKRISDFDPQHRLPLNEKETLLALRWIALKNFSEADVSLPIDKVVAKMLAQKFG